MPLVLRLPHATNSRPLEFNARAPHGLERCGEEKAHALWHAHARGDVRTKATAEKTVDEVAQWAALDQQSILLGALPQLMCSGHACVVCQPTLLNNDTVAPTIDVTTTSHTRRPPAYDCWPGSPLPE